MPMLTVDSMDDVLGFDACEEFRGGVNNWQAPYKLQLNEYVDGINVDLESNGLLRTRSGVTTMGGAALAAAKIQGVRYFDTATIERLFAVCNGVVSQWNGSSWAAVPGYTPNSAARMGIAQGIDRLYFSDGVNNMHNWNGAAWTDMGTTSPNPPLATLICWHTSRLFAAGVATASDTVYVSDILNPAAWNYVTQSLRVGGGEGQAIVGLLSWDNFNLVVLKESSSYIVVTDPQATVANWEIQPVHKSVGCVAGRTAAQVGADVWWLSRQGVVSIRRLVQETQREVVTTISDRIRGYIDRINWAHASKSSAVFYNNRYILSVPLDAATEPNAALVYNTLTQSWCGYWTNFNAQEFALTNFAGQLRLTLGTDDGRVKQYEDFSSVLTDDGVDVATQVDGRGMIFGDYRSPKAGCDVEFEFVQSEATASIEVCLDESDWQMVGTSFDTAQGGVTLPVDLEFSLSEGGTRQKGFDLQQFDPFRVVQFRVKSAAGLLRLRSMIASAWGNAMELTQ
jgi:hypothetical protein